MYFNNVEDPFRVATTRACNHVHEKMEPGKLDQDHVEVLCGPASVDGFSFPVSKNYPLVLKLDTECAQYTFFVSDCYIGGVTVDGEIKLTVPVLLPWYCEAIDRFMLPEGWSLKNWIFTGPDGQSFPYVPGICFDPDNGRVLQAGKSEDPDEIDRLLRAAAKRFSSHRARANYYIEHVLAVLAEKDGAKTSGGKLPSDVDQAMEMMRDLSVPSNIIQTAMQFAYSKGSGTEKEKRQSLHAWLGKLTQCPIIELGRKYEFPK